jgi:hypothetical protein
MRLQVFRAKFMFVFLTAYDTIQSGKWNKYATHGSSISLLNNLSKLNSAITQKTHYNILQQILELYSRMAGAAK